MEKDFETCTCHQNGGSDIVNYPPLNSLLPSEYDYIICSYKKDDEDYIESRFHTTCSTKDEVLQWLEQFSFTTKLEFSSDRDSTVSSQMIHVKCQCSLTKSCPTMLKITINSCDTTTNDVSFLHRYPTTVILLYSHNILNDDNCSEISEILIEQDLDDYIILSNDIDDSNDNFSSCGLKSTEKNSFDALITNNKDLTKGSDLEQFIRKKLYHLFDEGYSPQQAYNLYKKEIHEIFEKEPKAKDDKNARPGVKWVNKHFYAYLREKHGVEINTKKEKKFDANGVKKVNIKEREVAAHIERTLKEISTMPIDFFHGTDHLGRKIDEQLKKYVPILPAFNAPRVESEISLLSLPPVVTNINNVTPIFTQSTITNVNPIFTPSTPSTSYIIKFNSDQKNNKLNLFPLKLIPNAPVVQSSPITPISVKLPELKIRQNSDNKDHILEVSPDSNIGSQNIPIPSGVDGIIILTSDQATKPNSPNCETRDPPITEPPSETRKHRRKACLVYEDADEVVFTDNIEDLKEKVETRGKKSKRKFRNKNSIRKKRKVILPCPLDGIENVICHD